MSRNLLENVAKTLKPLAFLVAFYIIPNFSKTGDGNKKNSRCKEKCEH